ncbi:hypothetical protein ABVK25_007406 [Lepraria finkii]|uniref:Uncharacterized protein n=1 Tax=Lepraria finkii TaxID=1340010 RepID=A0ABR4B4K3_9LECA
MKSCALLISHYEAQHLPSDLAKAEERDKSNGKSDEELYVEIFVILAEITFLAYKISKSIHDRCSNRDDPEISGQLIVDAMDFIRQHTPSFGFMPDGQALFNVSKRDEHYASLYHGKPRDENFKVFEKAIYMQTG